MAISRKETHYTKQEYNLALDKTTVTAGTPVTSTVIVDKLNWNSALIGLALESFVGGTDGTSSIIVKIESADDLAFTTNVTELDPTLYVFPSATTILADATNDQNLTLSADLNTARRYIRIVVDAADLTTVDITAHFILGDGDYQPEGISSIYRASL